jgi:hypothetical protein
MYGVSTAYYIFHKIELTMQGMQMYFLHLQALYVLYLLVGYKYCDKYMHMPNSFIPATSMFATTVINASNWCIIVLKK